MSAPTLFRSFWLAGFESASHLNRHGVRVDMLAGTGHDRLAQEDFRRLRSVGVRSARDGVRWHLIERPGGWDFSSLTPHAQAACDEGVQMIWTLCHYGWPDDLDPFQPSFPDHFGRFAGAVARHLRELTDEVPFYTPMNEISFLAYAAGHVGYIAPFARKRGGEIKRQLVRAAIAAIEAIWDVDPRARIVHVDPVINVVTPFDRPHLAPAANAARESQFEGWDLLSGRQEPELGGKPEYLDIMGLNFYHANQWQHPRGRLRWEDSPRDPRWTPLHLLLDEVYRRYQRPLFLAETSHFGVGRAPWLREIGEEVEAALDLGVPLAGVCLYPILDRYDWENEHHWHNSGLWDMVPDGEGNHHRVLNPPYALELARVQRRLASRGIPSFPAPALEAMGDSALVGVR